MALSEDISKFRASIRKHNLWNAYEIRSTLIRNGATEEWNVLFARIELLRTGMANKTTLFENNQIKITVETRMIDTFDDFLNQFSKVNIIIHGLPASLQLVHQRSFFQFLDRQYTDFEYGLDYPCYQLSINADKSESLADFDKIIDFSLMRNNPPFEGIRDVTESLLNFSVNEYDPSPYEYNPHVSFFAPLFIKIQKFNFGGNILSISLSLKHDIDQHDLQVGLLGKIKYGTNKLRRMVCFDDKKLINDEWVFEKSIAIDNDVDYISGRLFFRQEEIDSFSIERGATASEKAYWSKILQERIDPQLDIIDRWLDGTNSTDFEKGVTLLFYLCGLKSIHVGGDYENATLNNRRKIFRISNMPVDIIVWSKEEDSLYLCQCSTGGTNNKTKEVSQIAHEMRDRLRGHNAPRIHSCIITNADRKYILKEIDDAKTFGVTIITIEDLKGLLEEVRRNKQPYSRSISILNQES